MKAELRPHDRQELVIRARLKQDIGTGFRSNALTEFGKLYTGLKLTADRIGWDVKPKGQDRTIRERLEEFAHDHFSASDYSMVTCFDTNGSFCEPQPGQQLFIWQDRTPLVDRYRAAFNAIRDELDGWSALGVESWEYELPADGRAMLQRLLSKLSK